MSKYNTLIKYLALNDTIHDFCNIGRNKSRIYGYDSDAFQHIILGLLKSDFDSIKNVNEFNIKSTYEKIYNTSIWNETISGVETKIEKIIYKYLEEINYVNKKNKKNYNLLEVKKLNTAKNFKVKKYDEYKLKAYSDIKKVNKDKELTFVLDANSIFHSKEFFCIPPKILKKEHYTIYNGLFSLYDAGSTYIDNNNKHGGATKDVAKNLTYNSNSSNSNSNNSSNILIKLNKLKCFQKEKYEYSLTKEENELIYVNQFGVILNTSKKKFELYRNIDENENIIELIKNQNETLSLGSFVALLSLIENTVRKSTEQRDNVLNYFKAITERTALQSICDIYKINLEKQGKNVSNYAKGIVTRLTKKQKEKKKKR